MSRKKSSGPERLLTEAELELMSILWKIGEGSVADVQAGLPAERELAYTSVSTILRILEQKKFVASKPRSEGRGHLYFSLLPKQEYEAASLKHLVTRVFEGTPSSLVRRLFETGDLSQSDLESIRALLNEAGEKSKT